MRRYLWRFCVRRRYWRLARMVRPRYLTPDDLDLLAQPWKRKP